MNIFSVEKILDKKLADFQRPLPLQDNIITKSAKDLLEIEYEMY